MDINSVLRLYSVRMLASLEVVVQESSTLPCTSNPGKPVSGLRVGIIF